MKLTSEQESAVREWLANGASLSEVQSKLKSELNVSITFIDLRMLVLDLGAEIKEKSAPKPAEAPKPEAPQAADFSAEDAALPAEPEAPQAADSGAPVGDVTVTIDRVVPAGAVAGGSVTFSDGVSATWVVDRMGRLGFTSISREGYRPSEEDILLFQAKLEQALGGGR